MKALWEKLMSRLNTHYRVGMRVVKTVVSVMICLIISLLVNDADLSTISAVSAIVTLRESSKGTISAGLLRLMGTLLGGLVGLACVGLGGIIPGYSQWLYVLVVPAMMLLGFYICNVLKLTDASAISSIVVLLVAAQANMGEIDATYYALQRLFDTMIGVAVATAVNMLIYPRKTGGGEQPDKT